ncbi:hypothetical protein GOBAR_DD28648 [Gossypium barbadense]|nr:hypothetical protein GOBAR_DD28648 [Gossypium barbadense]
MPAISVICFQLEEKNIQYNLMISDSGKKSFLFLQGVKPNVVTYTTLMKALIRVDKVVIDNNACEDATVIQVDSVNKHGILLEVVQVLTDMNLTITKAYISSDGGWFMDVFNVVDNDGNKIRDKEVPAVYEEMILSGCTPDRKARATLRSALRYMKQAVKNRYQFDQVTEDALVNRLSSFSFDDNNFEAAKQLCCSIARPWIGSSPNGTSNLREQMCIGILSLEGLGMGFTLDGTSIL